VTAFARGKHLSASLLSVFFVLSAMSSQVQAASDEYITPKTWLEGYKPNYFLYGTPDSKIQLSAKVQILEEARLYFGYSQLMFWNISYASSPIADVNFNPELFFQMNPDLLYYRGLYEVEFTCANFLGEAFTRSDLTLRVYSGGPSHLDPFAGGQELTLRFTRRMHPQIVPLWTLQVFNGYGEDLLYYNQRRTVFRGGLSF
jgi:outer membrane phospholipase A